MARLTRVAISSLLVAAVATACGSTISPAVDGAGRSGGLVPDLGSTSTAQPEGVTGAVDAPDVGLGSDSPGARGPNTVDPGESLPSAPSVSGALAPIKIGVVMNAGQTPFARGVVPDSTQEVQDAVHAMVRYLNKRGGIAGRQVKLTIATVDQTNPDAGEQTRLQHEACVALTEDAKVFAVLSLGPSFLAGQCYANHRTPLYQAYNNNSDSEDIRRFAPYYVPTLYLAPDRMARLLVDALGKQLGFMSQNMAIFSADYPAVRRIVSKYIVPGITARGGRVVSQVYGDPSVQGVGAASASSVLQWKAMGVDRVVMWFPGGAAYFIFQNEAESQAFRPWYGASTYDFLGKQPPGVHPEQLRHVHGPGFKEGDDIVMARRPPATAQQRACWTTIASSGGPTYTSKGTPPAETAFNICDLFLGLRAALAPRTGQSIAKHEVSGLFRALGSSFKPAQYVGATFGRGDDATQTWAPLGFDDACACILYQGPFRRITV